MGKKRITEKFSIKSMFVINFAFIVICSFLCTVATISIIWFIYSEKGLGIMKNAQYYEREIPMIVDYIAKVGDKLVDPKMKDKFEKILPKNGMVYQIMDDEGRYIYGTLKDKLIMNRKDLMFMVNTFYYEKNWELLGRKYEEYYPLCDEEGYLKGAVALKYGIGTESVYKKDYFLVELAQILMVIFPFIYIILFTIIFSRRFNRRIEAPANEIIEAARKIKEKDLDFEIKYKSNNILGKLAEAFEDMKEELKTSLFNFWKTEDEKKEMIKVIAHDLRTPLTVIQGHIELLDENENIDEEKRTKYISTIKNNTERMWKLINDINTASEIENPGFQLNPVELEISEFLEYKKQDYTLLTERSEIGFEMTIINHTSDDKVMKIDPLRIEQVLDNLISNSIRFTPKGRKIYLKSIVNETSMEFILEDEGTGFSPKDIPHLFDKFYRGDNSRRLGKGHCGLGLFIVKQLIEKHNGFIEVSNRETGGAKTRFVIKEL